MKFFISNRAAFEAEFTETPVNKNCKTGSQIHRHAFSVLQIEVSNNHIPITLMTEYDGDGMVLFEFLKRIDDVYFYEYIGTAK